MKREEQEERGEREREEQKATMRERNTGRWRERNTSKMTMGEKPEEREQEA